MATRATAEGLERGMLLVGPLADGGKNYLFMVNKVNGAHSVTAITHVGYGLAEITLRTNGLYGKDSTWRRVEFLDRALREAESPILGELGDTQIIRAMEAEKRADEQRRERAAQQKAEREARKKEAEDALGS